MKCAYCHEEHPLTREHVIPSFAYKFQKSLGSGFIGWNEKAKQMVGGEGTIKDVCSECNNGVLGALDAYGKELLTSSGLLVKNYTAQTLHVQYDYSLLTRWLLKISFNSARRDGAHRHLFDKHIPFMLGTAPAPARWQVAPLLYMANAEIEGNSIVPAATFASFAGGSKRLNPFFVRVSYGQFPGATNYVPRLLIFGPAVFVLLMFQDHVLPGHAASAIRQLAKAMPGIVELKANLKVAKVLAGKRTWLDLYQHQISRARAFQAGAA